MAVDPFDLNLRHLRALSAIAEHGGISLAARVVNLSQPALTQGLAKLERQFGQMLFERRAGRFVITAAGSLVMARARAASAHLAAGAKGLTKVFDRPDTLMTMTQIRAFAGLADAGGFAAAAKVTGLSQTAVHRAVGDLEQLVGSRLVERRGRGVWLNAAGKRLARGVRLAIGEIRSGLIELGMEGQTEILAFAASPLSRPFLVPAAMARLAKEFPQARFEVLEGSWGEAVEPLRDGRIDLIVGEVPASEVSDLAQEAITEQRLIIVGGKGHRLAGPRMPPMQALAECPWIVASGDSPTRAIWEELFAGRGLPPVPVVCGSVMIIGRLLTEGQFLALLSPDEVALQIRAGLLASVGPPLENSRRVVGFTSRRSWRPTAMQRRFLELLREVGASGESHASELLHKVGWV